MPSKLVLTRKADWFNRRQRYKVFINGREAGIIKNDETQEFELEPGTYSVQCKVNWASSSMETVDIVDIKDGKNTYLKVGNGMKLLLPLYIMMIVGLLFPAVLKFAKLPVTDTVNILKFVMILPAAIYILLYLTVFRKKYISIGQDESNPFR